MDQRRPTVRSGPWELSVVEDFLDRSAIPLRLASNGAAFPLVQSVWFVYDDGSLWCCTQSASVLAKRLQADPRCAFEVSGDQPPYRGVRGTGTARIRSDSAHEVLPRLIDRYLGDRPDDLARWLISRLDSEVAIQIEGLSVTSWDYSARM
ncbi:MAG: pyridoxamine 5'-phosphate oxidase family protein [Actinobacteria bacterium]|jgi:nitroimidazol reductase NimA-like FMN-containing flavoprotein (pyridoxamine 5'-phosphate oxidase superfamily)|nr:pyridoxamine 5'-phosphate oxidase family protein [Actinomycetota bacterium]